jgi:lysophospholipase L1-like esterase
MRASILGLTLVLAAGAVHAASVVPSVRVILVGDSTMATRSGYGDALCARFGPQVSCTNLARGGRSSKSFRVEGLWDAVLQLLDEGRGEGQFQRTYVLIQFGHNDQPGKAERSTTLPEFGANLQRYVEDVHDKAATAVLVTPLTRRQFRDGKLIRGLEDWAQATRAVAQKSDTPLLDLHADSAAAIEAAGPTVANTFAPGPPSAEVAAAALTGTTIEFIKPAQPDPDHPTFDYTHLGAAGATFFADMVIKEIQGGLPELARFIAD